MIYALFEAGADFVKMSTGFAGGATLEDATLIGAAIAGLTN